MCGRLGIALRGHRDDGQLNDEVDISGLSGNFRALLAFRIESGDKLLKEHLIKTNKNAAYISKTIQNTFIDLCGQEILNTIVSNIQKIGYFAILADETTDSSHQEQLCFCIHYVSEGAFIKEEIIIVSATINYINDSSRRRNVFDAQFISYCSTRFVERYDAIIRFCSNISSIVFRPGKNY